MPERRAAVAQRSSGHTLPRPAARKAWACESTGRWHRHRPPSRRSSLWCRHRRCFLRAGCPRHLCQSRRPPKGCWVRAFPHGGILDQPQADPRARKPGLDGGADGSRTKRERDATELGRDRKRRGCAPGRAVGSSVPSVASRVEPDEEGGALNEFAPVRGADEKGGGSPAASGSSPCPSHPPGFQGSSLQLLGGTH